MDPRRTQALLHPAGQSDHVRRAGKALSEEDELVSPQSGQGVLGPHDRLQPMGRLHEQQVARLMAEAVVDILEVVEVAEQDADHSRLAAHPLQG